MSEMATILVNLLMFKENDIFNILKLEIEAETV